MKDKSGASRFGIGRVTRFYVPLLLQAFSQSLTYPLVAGIVTHGEFGVNGLTAFSQGLMIMFMNGAFFLRNVPMVVLFNNYESGKANIATIARIGATLACAAVFPRYGMTGAGWGLFALTLGVIVEYSVTWWYARPYVEALKGTRISAQELSARELGALVLEQFRFTLPLGCAGWKMAVTAIFIAPVCTTAAVYAALSLPRTVRTT